MSAVAVDLLKRVPAHDSISEMERAREDRYWDALTSAIEAREFAACYLLGYVAEMALKTAYFKFSGVPAMQSLQPALQSARRLGPFVGSRNLHDLVAWATALINVRHQAGRPIDPALAAALQYRAAVLAANWEPALRYKAAVPAHDVVELTLSTVDWFRDHYVELWS